VIGIFRPSRYIFSFYEVANLVEEPVEGRLVDAQSRPGKSPTVFPAAGIFGFADRYAESALERVDTTHITV
jgi:hypothetical protein